MCTWRGCSRSHQAPAFTLRATSRRPNTVCLIPRPFSDHEPRCRWWTNHHPPTPKKSKPHTPCQPQRLWTMLWMIHEPGCMTLSRCLFRIKSLRCGWKAGELQLIWCGGPTFDGIRRNQSDFISRLISPGKLVLPAVVVSSEAYITLFSQIQEQIKWDWRFNWGKKKVQLKGDGSF